MFSGLNPGLSRGKGVFNPKDIPGSSAGWWEAWFGASNYMNSWRSLVGSWEMTQKNYALVPQRVGTIKYDKYANGGLPPNNKSIGFSTSINLTEITLAVVVKYFAWSLHAENALIID